MAVIRVAGVWKQFRWHHQAQARTLKEFLVSLLPGKRFGRHSGEPFSALRNVSFDVHPGEMVGIIGANGSGKSTILKLITGISKPTQGSIEVNGRISALLELGAGFHPDFTGRENVFLNASILGLRRKEIQARFDSIVDFAELRDFIDAPVKTYSSGMYMRLAFAIAVNVDPDILVVDEVLAVGDASFQAKCFDQINRFRKEGKTILLVTHDLSAVANLCDRAIWLNKGVLMADGLPKQVIEAYHQQIAANDNTPKDLACQPISIADLRFEGSHPCEDAWSSESAYKLRFTLGLDGIDEEVRLGIKVSKSDGVCCYADHYPITQPAARNRIELDIPSMPLLSGSYILEVSAVAGPSFRAEKHFFNVNSPKKEEGIAPLYCQWMIHPEAAEGVNALHSV